MITDGAAEEESPISDREKREAQGAAQVFVKRMQQTRDVAALIDELFVPDFVSHFVSGDCDCLPPELYLCLSDTDRLRWFVALNNLSYLITLDVLHRPANYTEDESHELAFKSILPDTVAAKLQSLTSQEKDFQIGDSQAFQSLLLSLERALAEARPHLLRQGIEQTPEFQKELDDTVQDTGINYRVRAYIGGDDVKDCEPLIGFPANQKFYRVEIPLMMGVILVEDERQMKIVRLTYVDGD